MYHFITMMAVSGVITLSFVSMASEAGDSADITLPAPRMEGGKPLMQALKERRSSREFGTRELSTRTLSDLLWAAFGINRSDGGKRTAPSARNWQEIEIYAVMKNGVYLYDAQSGLLRMISKGDFRKATGGQDFVATAPLNLVYVADPAKMKGSSGEDATLYSAADAGFISQNVYLFCASEGLATVVRGMVNRESCAKALRLSGRKKVVLAQTVGYPGE